jgi:hypothetical protein
MDDLPELLLVFDDDVFLLTKRRRLAFSPSFCSSSITCFVVVDILVNNCLRDDSFFAFLDEKRCRLEFVNGDGVTSVDVAGSSDDRISRVIVLRLVFLILPQSAVAKTSCDSAYSCTQ